jgi:hypothetical protein
MEPKTFFYGFGRENMQKCIDACLKEGYVPADARRAQAYALRSNEYFFTRTIVDATGLQRNATMKELHNIESVIKDGNKIIVINIAGCVEEVSYHEINDYDIQFVGVKSRGKR